MTLPHTAMPFLWHYIKHFKWSFLTLTVTILAWAMNEALFPYFTKLMVDGVSSATPGTTDLFETFKTPILGIAISWITMEISMRIYGYVEVYVQPLYRAKIRTDVFDYVKGQSLAYFTKNMSGSVGSKIHDISKSSHHIIDHMLGHIIAIVFAFILSTFVVAQVSLIFAGIMLIWCAFHMGITFYYLREVNDKVSMHYESVANLNGETIDIITNATSMRLFARHPFETKRLGKFQSLEIQKSRTAGFCIQKVNLIRGLAGVLFIFANTYVLLKGWQDGWLSAGDFPLVAMSSFNLMGLIWHMSMALVDMFTDIGTLNGALSILRTPQSVTDQAKAIPLVCTKGEISFDHVTFGYREHDPLFKELSLTIQGAEKVGLVGFSGSGKTSFVNLILREFDVSSGAILIDGMNTAKVAQQSLREHVSVIPQDTNMFHRSIMENIRYGDLKATEEEVIEAAKAAHCHEFILNLEHGYETVVGERGLRLSGGQRQRLAIARAMLKNAPILILDEATSALDSATEKLIHESLMALMQGRTTIVVAHRLSTLRMMDRILVFNKGAIIEQGTHKQLLAAKGHFAHLWSLQHDGFLPDKEA